MAIPRPTPKPAAAPGSEPEQAAQQAPVVRRPPDGNRPVVSPRFVEAKSSPEYGKRLIVDIAGEEKTGKTHFGLTAPGPVFMHSFDIGTEGVLEKFVAQGKRIMVAEYQLTLQPGEGTDKQVADAANHVWEQFVENFRDGLASAGQGTTLVDTGTEMWELIRLARFGRLVQIMPHHYTSLNKEMQGLIRESYNHNGSTVYTTKMKPEWESYIGPDGKEKSRKTGRMERSGFKDMPFQVQVVGECTRADRVGGGSDFGLMVESCRQNPEINGVEVPNDFDMLLTMVFP